MRSGAFVFHDIPYECGNIDHIVVGKNKIFAVETKAVRKPSNTESNSKEFKVKFDGSSLIFPHYITKKPIAQALKHANFLKDVIENKCGINFPVVAVVALPGWYIQNEFKSKDLLIINPKRGKALKNWIGELEDKNARDKVAVYLASVARSVEHRSDRSDPNASKKYDFWLNPRPKETTLGD